MRHIAIILAKNEERFIGRTLRSLLAQTEPPDRVYVVDDGSDDRTPEIVEEFARESPSIVLVRRPPGALRQLDDGVVHAFADGYRACRHLEFTYLSRLDADLDFPPDYFQRLLAFMDAHPDWGSAGGVPLEQTADGRGRRWKMPGTHVPGALKTMRREAYDRMGGFVATYSWDIVDLVKLRALGWRTGWVDIEVEHLRPHGSAQGTLRGRMKWGEGAWIIGTHPLFALGRGAYRMLRPPYLLGGLAFWWGYLRAALRRVPQLADRDLVRALRREQMQRLLGFNRL